MKIEELRKVLAERIRIDKISQGEWDYGIEECWKREIEILSEDIPSTIEFLENDCTGEEFCWISEVIDDVTERTHSKELIECYKKLMNKFPKECEKYNISGSVQYAEEMLKGVDMA